MDTKTIKPIKKLYKKYKIVINNNNNYLFRKKQ